MKGEQERSGLQLLDTRVGPYHLLVDPQHVLAVEPQRDFGDDDVIVSCDLRGLLGVEPSRPEGDCLLVATDAALFRLGVCSVGQLIRCDTRHLFRVPAVLHPLSERLGLRAVFQRGAELCYLLDLTRLADYALAQRAGAA